MGNLSARFPQAGGDGWLAGRVSPNPTTRGHTNPSADRYRDLAARAHCHATCRTDRCTDRYADRRAHRHADHRAAGEVTIDAVFPAARNRMYHPELLDFGLDPHVVKEIYLAGPDQANHWVDISEVFDIKVKAIQCHVSQVREPEKLEERLKDRNTATDQYGQEVLREEFRVMRIG